MRLKYTEMMCRRNEDFDEDEEDIQFRLGTAWAIYLSINFFGIYIHISYISIMLHLYTVLTRYNLQIISSSVILLDPSST